MKEYKYIVEDKHFGEVNWIRRTNDPKRAKKLLNDGVYDESGYMFSGYYSGERVRTLYVNGKPATAEQIYHIEME